MLIDSQSLTVEVEQKDIVVALYKESIGSTVVSVCCALVLVFGFQNEHTATTKVIWLGILLSFISFRIVDTLYWYKYLQGTAFNASAAYNRVFYGVCAIACTWSVYPILIINNTTEFLELAMIVIVLTALSGGSATILSASKNLATIYTSFLMLPLSALLVLHDSSEVNLLGFLSFAFTTVIIFSSVRSANFRASAFQLNNHNIALVEQLEQKNHEILDINAKLETRVQARTSEIFKLSNIDPLTGLFNRKAFSSQLNNTISEHEQNGQPFALFFIDLDGFKSINDIYGHAAGDKILKVVADRISAFIRHDDHICRWGGDEFLCIVEGSCDQESITLGEALIKKLCEPIEDKHLKLAVDATIGIAVYPMHARTESALISLADVAMYHQKNIRKASACMFSEQMRSSLLQEQHLKQALKRAIEQQLFYLHYQPIVNPVTREILYTEVLLRLKTKDVDIKPAEFIPIAEQYGFMEKIGDWVLVQACKELSDLIKQHQFDISLNVSVSQLVQKDFVGQLKEHLNVYDVPLEKVHLEITETNLSKNIERMLFIVQQLQLLGLKISIDDFGTGFSSLSQLQKLSPDTIKIDQSFTQSIEYGGLAIIQAIVQMSKELHFNVVVEGIETQFQADRLQEVGVDYSQGFHYAKPMSANKLEAWLKDWYAQ